ncbi:MAG: anti-sigma factor antagonist [Acidobacteria bacterium]|nr:MAG: anti-sigma factor antagonist [Acidobacteriota bacterium]REJ98129.1 MAG: anti-sigma factor antagonist [Acidobacteriota bacterium]REK16872.1 MAG: anti-sigma factor antagonist [Acidobacteriota bacterium]REK42783.1 MAG: anti-sigma factor antagonist [Acidobacteriota bacterium]
MSTLEIAERDNSEGTVLDLTGDIIFGEANTVLRTAIRNRLREGKSDIRLNLDHVGYLDSSGIGELISALTAVNREGGRLVLMNPGDRIMRLFEIAKLTEIFEIER